MAERQRALAVHALGIGAAWGQMFGDTGDGSQVGRLLIET